MPAWATQGIRWLLCCGPQTAATSKPRRAVTVTRKEISTGNRGEPVAKVFHESRWIDLAKDGNLILKPHRLHPGGTIVILLLGSPGIGKRSLMNKVNDHVSNHRLDLATVQLI